MAPVEASVSGAISSSAPVLADGRLKVVRDRYVNAMSVLTSVDDTPGSNGRSKLTTYVDKQTAWAQAVASYSRAQAVALESFKPTGPSPTSEQARKSREDYMQWLQENGRDVINTSMLCEGLIITSYSSNIAFKPDTWTGSCMDINSW